MLITQENSLLIFGDSGFSRSGALKIALSTSRNLAIREGIHMYLDVFRCIYSYLWLFIFYLPYLKIIL
ncbi:hypothetical protein JNE102603_0255 [Escherichia coli]|nr:hypothetical protein JNE102603_0255 [Escherichia coli]